MIEAIKAILNGGVALLLLASILIILSLAGCTDAAWDAQFGSLSESHNVDCYSGGQKIFENSTTGKVFSLEGGGFAFRT